jgi:phosphopantothenoylcysteine decarboxylase
VKVVATQAALYFVDPAKVGLEDSTHPTKISGRNRDVVILDEDEWPGQESGRRYERDDPVLHIELRRWADLLLIAPLDANTLAKLAAGLADNCLTCVWRAWDPHRPVILAPAMNTLMWEHPLTARHLRQVAASQFVVLPLGGSRAGPPEDGTTNIIPEHLDSEQLMDWLNQNCPRFRIVPPVSKRLACGDVGVGAMASVAEIVNAVQTCPSPASGWRAGLH